MDLFNRKKLQLAIEDRDELVDENKNLRNQIELLEKRLRGDRVCGGYCSVCKHAIPTNSPIMSSKQFYCDLDNKCKDFSHR